MSNAPQSPDPQRYQVIPRVLVFLTRGENVLLMRRAEDRPIFPGQYNGLGGHMEEGESVVTAARREVFEESGLTVEDLWLCAVVAIDVGESPGIQMHVFRGKAPEGDLKTSLEGTLEWVPQDGYQNLDLVEDIPILLPRVLAMKPGAAPLWGFYRYDEAGKLIAEFNKLA